MASASFPIPLFGGAGSGGSEEPAANTEATVNPNVEAPGLDVEGLNELIGGGTDTLKDVNKLIEDFAEAGEVFTDPATFIQPFQESFDRFSETAQKAALVEIDAASAELAAFQNNNPDPRGAVNLALSRKIKGDIFFQTLNASQQVFDKFAENVFRGITAAQQSFETQSSTLLSASTDLAGITTAFITSLSGDAASVYDSQLDYAASLNRDRTSRDVANINASVARDQIASNDRNAALDRELQRELANAQNLDVTGAQPSGLPNVPVPPPPLATPSVPQIEPPRNPNNPFQQAATRSLLSPVGGTTLSPIF